MDDKMKEAVSGNIGAAYLILADGTVYKGKSLGVMGTSIGEVVFTTGMTGFQETLTDPSFYGQIVTQTFPLAGNYGFNDEDSESGESWVKGYIVREWCQEPSNFRCKYTLDEFLKKENVVGIYDIDTRSLTKKIRESGVMNGAITHQLPGDMDRFLKEVKDYRIQDAVKSVSKRKEHHFASTDANYHVALYDLGTKKSILKSLLDRGCNVTVVPYNTGLKELKEMNPDGIVLSNGPGDPEDCRETIEIVKELMETDIPLLGICLGHQLLALANGAKTEKLKYGHRGANQPIMDKTLNQVFVTCQNHGYAVIGDSLSEDIGWTSHYNVNDGSCEGIEYARGNAFSVQYHPEACAGPKDTQYQFDRFVEFMSKRRK